MDACYKAKDKGADVVKQWDATLDSSTRESHVKVDMEIRELDEKFSNGLMYPGDPGGGAAEVVNCRCALDQRARWALEGEFTKRDGFTGELKTFESQEAYDEYKKAYFSKENKQYMKYVEEMQDKYNSGNFEKVMTKMTDAEYKQFTKLQAARPTFEGMYRNQPYVKKINAKKYDDFKREYLKTAEYASKIENSVVDFVAITKASYENVAKHIPETWDETQKESLKTAFYDLLKETEKYDVGVECGALYTRNMKFIKNVNGKSGKVSLPDYDDSYIAMHTHPDCLTFSHSDIEQFIGRGDMEVLFAVGNNGSVYMVEKTERYSASDLLLAFNDIENRYPHMNKSPTDYANAMGDFLKGAEQYGVRYYEGTA